MSDTLYLSLWYPNLRLEALAEKLALVLASFAAHGGDARVYSATVWPVDWSESPVFERVWGRMEMVPSQQQILNPEQGLSSSQSQSPARGADPRQAVEEAMELLHDDYAYEFQIGWNLWEIEPAGGSGLDPRWARAARRVRVVGYGPLFAEGTYEQDGHIRIDFGSDGSFLAEEADLGQIGARHVEENIRQLIALAAAVEKNSGATARLLWSELGESLAERLAARLGTRN
jgi:hypothetical protein